MAVQLGISYFRGHSIDLHLRSRFRMGELVRRLPKELQIPCRELDRRGQQVVVLLHVVTPGAAQDLAERALTKDG